LPSVAIARLSAKSAVSRQAITKHLKVLSGAGLVRGTRRGREQIWQLEPKRLGDARTYLDLISRQWDEALDRLKGLQRTTNTRDNLADFTCADTITPQNNAGTMMELPSSTSCTAGETPTETPPAGDTATATPTATATRGVETATATATPSGTPGPPIACVADCNESGDVSLDEVVHAVGIALARHPLATCEQADPNGDGFPDIGELVRAVAGSVGGCID
jgi:hypothetical protein